MKIATILEDNRFKSWEEWGKYENLGKIEGKRQFNEIQYVFNFLPQSFRKKGIIKATVVQRYLFFINLIKVYSKLHLWFKLNLHREEFPLLNFKSCRLTLSKGATPDL